MSGGEEKVGKSCPKFAKNSLSYSDVLIFTFKLLNYFEAQTLFSSKKMMEN